MNKAIFIYGPTAVGKTAFAHMLSSYIPCEIINLDAAQLYTPLNIGTAKPNWRDEKVPHHLFDICDQPIDYSVAEYRKSVISILTKIKQRGNIPVFVGGSGFYMYSLFFPPMGQEDSNDAATYTYDIPSDISSWEYLHMLDPIRASEIHPHDIYRIKRAITLYQQTKIYPSNLKPMYCPIIEPVFVFLTQPEDILKKSITDRCDQMFLQGWVSEVEYLTGTPWECFLTRKKWIGYPELIAYCNSGKISELSHIKETIQKDTWRYARKQCAYARMFTKKINIIAPDVPVMLFDLTSPSYELYINQLVHSIFQKESGNE